MNKPKAFVFSVQVKFFKSTGKKKKKINMTLFVRGKSDLHGSVSLAVLEAEVEQRN